MQEIKNVKGASLINQAVDMMTEFILESGIKTGDFLPTEQELGKQLGVGRSTLREAVKALESKGLVKRLHGQGVQVVEDGQRAITQMLRLMAKRSGATMQEFMEAWQVIAGKAAGLAAKRATPEDHKLIRSAMQAMQVKDASIQEYTAARAAFHLAVAHAAHSILLPLVLETIHPVLEAVILDALRADPQYEHDLQQQEKICSAIEKGDKHKASKAMKACLRGVHASGIAGNE